VTLCAAKPKAVFADNLLSDMAGLDGSSALQASIATNDQPGTNYVLALQFMQQHFIRQRPELVGQ
jgi:hypothetical protein